MPQKYGTFQWRCPQCGKTFIKDTPQGLGYAKSNHERHGNCEMPKSDSLTGKETCMDWQDRDAKARLEMCRGCDDLKEREQVRFYKGDGHTKYDPPKYVMHPWCSEYKLHLEFIDRIIGEGYSENGQGKYCDKFRN